MANRAIKQYALRFPIRGAFSAVRRKVLGAAAYRSFGPLLKLHGLKASKHVDALIDSYEEFLTTGTDTGADTFWKSFVKLNKLADKLPAEPRYQVSLELMWLGQGVLFKETNAARKVSGQKILKGSNALQNASKAVTKGVKGAGKAATLLPDPAALAALGKLKEVVRRSNRTLWAVWKRFDEVVWHNDSGVIQALRRITDKVDSIRKLLKKRDFVALDKGHMHDVRSLLSEGYALHSKRWLKEADKLLIEAQELALKRGDGWAAQYLTQLDDAIEISGREGPDAVVVLLNPNTLEAVVHAVVQIKAEKRLKGLKQLYDDLRRFLGETVGEPFGTIQFRLNSGETSAAYKIVGGDSLPKLHVLTAADTEVIAADLDFLKNAGASIPLIQLDLTINQLSRLAVNCIEAILKYY